MALIFCFTPILFAGCEAFDMLEEDFENSLGGSSGGEGSSGELLDGFKVVYSESQIGQDKEIQLLTTALYFEKILTPLGQKYGSGPALEGENNFFPDAIRQTIINDGGTAKLVDGAPVWNWTLNKNDETSTEAIKNIINIDGGFDYYELINEFAPENSEESMPYPQLSDLKYYSTPIQIVLYETMLGYEQTTFKVDTTNVFEVVVENCHKQELIGENATSSAVVNYLGDWDADAKTGNGLMEEYYTNATYSGLTKADADELITYILDEVIGKEVVKYDYDEFKASENTEFDNYRNYVGTVAEMIYEAVYDGSKEFVYNYELDGETITYDFIEKNAGADLGELMAHATYRPRSSSFLRDYETDMFFESGDAFDDVPGATPFENSPMSEYQSVVVMPSAEDFEFGGMIMQIFSPNPELAITVYVRFWAYDEETGEGKLFEWEQPEINFYHEMPYTDEYKEKDCEYHDYVEGKGYLYKTTDKDNDGNLIEGYFTDFEVAVDLTDVPEKFQAPYDRNDPTKLEIDRVKLPKFENSEEDPKLKANGETSNGITEANLFKNGGYAYKVIPSKNGFGGVTVLDENQIDFSFFEMVFDIQKDPTLANTNYDYKLAVLLPL